MMIGSFGAQTLAFVTCLVHAEPVPACRLPGTIGI